MAQVFVNACIHHPTSWFCSAKGQMHGGLSVRMDFLQGTRPESLGARFCALGKDDRCCQLKTLNRPDGRIAHIHSNTISQNNMHGHLVNHRSIDHL